MKIVFTICSNNYLSQAISLGKSVKNHNPDYDFIICLVDKILDDERYLKHIEGIEIVPIEQIGIPEFEGMVQRYSIVELNTAVKPFFAEYLFKKFGDADTVIYLDPDILVYSSFTNIDKTLTTNNIVLTPHFTTPDYENITQFEMPVLNVGIYNLGFIALKRSEDAFKMLTWWKLRLREHCLMDFNRGLFVDQLWANYIPLFFKNVFIERNLGYNIAYWNFYERKVTESEGSYFVNGDKLVFFHFSNCNPRTPEILCRWLPYSFEERPDLLPLYQKYTSILMENGYEYFTKLSCFYMKAKPQKIVQKRSVLKRIQNKISYYFNR